MLSLVISTNLGNGIEGLGGVNSFYTRGRSSINHSLHYIRTCMTIICFVRYCRRADIKGFKIQSKIANS